jgi:hypothetical protein
MMKASDQAPLRNIRVRESEFKHQCSKEFGGLPVLLTFNFLKFCKDFCVTLF